MQETSPKKNHQSKSKKLKLSDVTDEMCKRRLTKPEYKNILRQQREIGRTFSKKEKRKLFRMRFDNAHFFEGGFFIQGNNDGAMDWFANNTPGQCARVDDLLDGKERSIH